MAQLVRINPKRIWAERTRDKIKQVEITGTCRK
jgi:lambda repressor-like predicted transcriptional regulator